MQQPELSLAWSLKSGLGLSAALSFFKLQTQPGMIVLQGAQACFGPLGNNHTQLKAKVIIFPLKTAIRHHFKTLGPSE